MLSAIPSGGMYIKMDIFRFSAGAAAQQTAADSTGMGMGFAQQYFSLLGAGNRAGLASVYTPKSQLSFESQTVVGSEQIVPKLATMPNGKVDIGTLDAAIAVEAGAPVNGVAPAVLVMVTGTFKIENEANALNFMQIFFLAVEGAAPYCANDVFFFNYS